MAYQEITNPSAVLTQEIALTRKLFARIGAGLSQIGLWIERVATAMANASTGQARFERVQMLNAKSDAQLAEMGIERDEIVHHVFGDLYYC